MNWKKKKKKQANIACNSEQNKNQGSKGMSWKKEIEQKKKQEKSALHRISTSFAMHSLEQKKVSNQNFCNKNIVALLSTFTVSSVYLHIFPLVWASHLNTNIIKCATPINKWPFRFMIISVSFQIRSYAWIYSHSFVCTTNNIIRGSRRRYLCPHGNEIDSIVFSIEFDDVNVLFAAAVFVVFFCPKYTTLEH